MAVATSNALHALTSEGEVGDAIRAINESPILNRLWGVVEPWIGWIIIAVFVAFLVDRITKSALRN